MRKGEIIQSTLKAMGRWEDPANDASPRYSDNPDPYDSIVIRTLEDRLSDVEYQTCADFAQFGVECCSTCHHYCPHVEMIIEEVSGGKAWICCAVSRALHGEDLDDWEGLELEEALGGGIRRVQDEDPGGDVPDSS